MSLAQIGATEGQACENQPSAHFYCQEEKGTTEGEMIGWHHQLNGHEFEQTQRASEGQGSLACYSPWGRKELDMTERLNSNNWQVIWRTL